MSINQRIFARFMAIFLLFSAIIFLFEYRYAKNTSAEKHCAELDVICQFIKNAPDPMNVALPDTTWRFTLLDTAGIVRYDNQVPEAVGEDFSQRKEIRKSTEKGSGYQLRHANDDDQAYFFYAIHYPKGYIRVAKPYENLSDAIENYSTSIFWMLLFFMFAALSFYAVARRFGVTINSLKRLIEKVDSGDKFNFPENEFSEISEYIVRSYKKLERTQKALDMEREKLMAHLRLSKRGLAIFSPQRKEIISNELFIQYANIVSDKQIQYSENVFDIPELFELVEFFDDRQGNYENKLETKTLEIKKNDKILIVHGIVFPDKSCEITVDDITEKEEQDTLKRQLTQNISHELKTPVSSIQGFMETLINNPNMDEEKKAFFIQRCYSQAVRLSYLLQDISMLNKLDEASGIFAKDDINLNEVINSVLSDVSLELQEKNIHTEVYLPDNLHTQGNMSLLYSIFRNLVDNTLHYAGDNINIIIRCIRVDNEFIHFSYADTGVGVDESHLNHLFERFYRVDKGRSRKLGGTGLGLAIVKNGIRFHQGRITAKQHPGGGLEFIFSLRKELKTKIEEF